MELKEYLKEKTYGRFFIFSIFLIILSLIFSFSIYLEKMSQSMDEDLKTLKTVKIKLDKTEEFQMFIQRIFLPEIEKSWLSVARFLDSLNLRFPQFKIDISNPKKDGRELFYDLNIQGEGDFSTLSELINFLETEKYPILFVKSVKIDKKEGFLDFKVKCEIRVIDYEE